MINDCIIAFDPVLCNGSMEHSVEVSRFQGSRSSLVVQGIIEEVSAWGIKVYIYTMKSVQLTD